MATNALQPGHRGRHFWCHGVQPYLLAGPGPTGAVKWRNVMSEVASSTPQQNTRYARRARRQRTQGPCCM
eukprot:4202825-Prymnesium_polylepis.1